MRWQGARRAALIVVALGSVALAAPSPAGARPGDLDPSFGSGGIVTTAFEGNTPVYSAANTAVLQPDGRPVTGGWTTTSDGDKPLLARYLPDGSLDPSFGDGGVVAANLGDASAIDSVALQPDGSILALGRSSPYGSSPAVLARFAPGGSLDTSFGTGGIATIDLGGSILGSKIALQDDGKILVAGETNDYTPPPSPASVGVARLDANGSLDPSFGNSGVATIAFNDPGATISPIGLLVQPDQRIVVSGLSQGGFATARLNSDGSLDGSFGSGGKVVTSVGSSTPYTVSSLLQPDGRIVLAGSISGVTLVRYNADGSLDSSFGAGGIVTDNQCCSSSSPPALQNDGKLVVAGPLDQGFAATRFSQDGTVDSGFGSNGIATASFDREYASVGAVLADATGRLELVGHTGVCLDADHLGCQAQSSDLSLARFTSGGALDPAFGTGGMEVASFGTVQVQASSIVDTLLTGSNGAVVAVGPSGAAQIGVALARYLSDGELDPSFGTGGRVVTDGVVPIGSLMQDDGKIVVVTKTGLLRYGADGSPDDSFGDQGVVTLPSRVKSAALSGDGFVVADNTCCIHGKGHSQLERLRSNGSLDRSFGEGGSFRLPGGLFAPAAVLVQRGRRIVVVGGRGMLAVTPKGRIDRSFGHRGRVSVPLRAGERMATALPSSRRRILLMDRGTNGVVLRRFLPNGHPDRSFGRRGVAFRGVPAPGGAGVAVTHGRIVVATNLEGEPALVRFNSDGSRDRSFGNRGRVTLTIADGAARAVAVAPGRIILGGDVLSHTHKAYEFLLARFRG
jgi:uncharacterized delta-60 repeat protein